MSMNALRKLLCTPAGPASLVSRREELGKQQQQQQQQQQQLAVPGHKSLAVTSDEVKKQQMRMLAREKKSIDRKYSHAALELEAKFKKLLNQERGKDGMDKSHMRKTFKKLGITVESDLFDKLWMLFDADKNGTVNAQEFVVTFCVLTLRGTARDNVELAFRLFDTNRDGAISRREFNDMIASVLGARLKDVLDVELGRECFETYLASEVADELLRFVDAVELLASDRAASFSRDYADSVWEQFLEVDAPDQVNVSDAVREKCRADLAACGSGAAAVPVSLFDAAAREAVSLIEEGPLPRFKHKLRTSYALFADRVWDDLGLDPNSGLTEAQFRDWVGRTPGLFRFLDDLHVILQEFDAA